MTVRAQVVCVVCGRTFRGTLLTWPWPQDVAERWRIPWHKHDGDTCTGTYLFEHRRLDTHREAS